MYYRLAKKIPYVLIDCYTNLENSRRPQFIEDHLNIVLDCYTWIFDTVYNIRIVSEARFRFNIKIKFELKAKKQKGLPSAQFFLQYFNGLWSPAVRVEPEKSLKPILYT